MTLPNISPVILLQIHKHAGQKLIIERVTVAKSMTLPIVSPLILSFDITPSLISQHDVKNRIPVVQ